MKTIDFGISKSKISFLGSWGKYNWRWFDL